MASSRYERQADKVLGLFSDGRWTQKDWSHVAFYVVQNGRLHERYLIERIRLFGAKVDELDDRYWRYDNEPLF